MPCFKKKSSGHAMDKKFLEDSLKSHNEYRKAHGVPPLKANKEIARVSQKWADHLACTRTFQHSSDRDYKGERMGENIAMKWTSKDEEFSGAQVTKQWYDEVTKYNFKTHSGAGTGHFTQIVWKGSKEFGIGKAKAKDGKWIVVANYFPAGNLIGHNADHVFPAANLIGPNAGHVSPADGTKMNSNKADVTSAGARKNKQDQNTRKNEKTVKRQCCCFM